MLISNIKKISSFSCYFFILFIRFLLWTSCNKHSHFTEQLIQDNFVIFLCKVKTCFIAQLTSVNHVWAVYVTSWKICFLVCNLVFLCSRCGCGWLWPRVELTYARTRAARNVRVYVTAWYVPVRHPELRYVHFPEPKFFNRIKDNLTQDL